tara:strand:- start:36821 stop:37417 length:597 start_codon:yes stop_codon:yes gene_type:complete
MQGILLLIFSFIFTFFISKTTNLKPLINYNDKNDYLPIFTSNLYADLLIIFITFTGILGTSKSWKVLGNWYKKYRLSAMLADILIGVIYLLIARYVVYVLKWKVDLFQFGVIAVLIQILFDFLFYLFFKMIPKGSNDMLDLFKDWAKFAKADALWGDSILVLVGVVLSSFLKEKSFNMNMFLLIIGGYLTPYIIYMKD